MIKIMTFALSLFIVSIYGMQYQDEVQEPVIITQAKCNSCNQYVWKNRERLMDCGHMACFDCHYYSPIVWCNECHKAHENNHYDAEAWHRYLLNSANP